MNCPRCKVPLRKTELKEGQAAIEVDQCPSCEGMWLDKGEIHFIEKVVEPLLWENRKIPKNIDQLIGLNCPYCAGESLMKKAEHPRDNNVILDYCTDCEGVWLDKGEIRAIQQENWLITIKNLLFSTS